MSVKYETVDVKDIEVIRELFDKLMQFQKSKAHYGKWIFDRMTMEFRVYKDLEQNKFKDTYLILVKDDDKPVGFAYSVVNQESCGNLKLFYLEPKYRGKGIGSKLFDMSMEWIAKFDTQQIVIFVSLGNDEAMRFYTSRGFEFKKKIFFGMISRLEKAQD